MAVVSASTRRYVSPTISCVVNAMPSGPASPKGPNSSLRRDSRYKLTSVSFTGTPFNDDKAGSQEAKGIQRGHQGPPRAYRLLQASILWRSHNEAALPSRRAGCSYMGNGLRQKLISLYWLSHICIRMITASFSGSALKCWCQHHFDTRVASPVFQS